jgi:hypothetical protein
MSANGDSTIEMNERVESADPEIVFQVRDNVDGNEIGQGDIHARHEDRGEGAEFYPKVRTDDMTFSQLLSNLCKMFWLVLLGWQTKGGPCRLHSTSLALHSFQNVRCFLPNFLCHYMVIR